MNACFHCGLPCPESPVYSSCLDQLEKRFCCAGCQAVAEEIYAQGLGGYYELRQQPANSQVDHEPSLLIAEDLDHPAYQARFVHNDGNIAHAEWIVSGMTCTACSWLIERSVRKIEGIHGASLNFSTERLHLSYEPGLSLAHVARTIESLGYEAQPFLQQAWEEHLQNTARTGFRRLAVAGLGAMQAMMFAAGLYLGASQGISPEFRDFLRWVTFAVSVPVVLYAGWPFYRNAITSLRHGVLTMDFSVSMAVLLGFTGSIHAMLTHRGETYFDSISMLIFFISASRFLEFKARHSAGTYSANTEALKPTLAWKKNLQGIERVPTLELQPDDTVLVKTGEIIPCDGLVKEGTSLVHEAFLSGESIPIQKFPGDRVIAGSINLEQPLFIRVDVVGDATVLGGYERLLQQALASKPALSYLADRIASVFIAGVLIVSALTYLGTSRLLGSDIALWRALSVLIVTCPCALALAIPAAWTVSMHRLASIGMMVIRPQILDRLPKVDTILSDKTGTLTEGQFHFERCISLHPDYSCQQLLEIMCSLEDHSEHVLARAFQKIDDIQRRPVCEWARLPELGGIEGRIDGIRYFAGRNNDWEMNQPVQPDQQSLWLALFNEQRRILGWFALSDRLRPEAIQLVSELKNLSIHLILLSGDQEVQVKQVAKELGIATWYAEQTPADKLAYLRQIQAIHGNVLVLGDGVNDAPVLAAAPLSIAMGSGSSLAQNSSDAIVFRNNLSTIIQAIVLSKKTKKIINQNLLWSVLYNCSMVPLAALGFVPPWLAALGMSLSSIGVVLNALRLRTIRLKPTDDKNPTHGQEISTKVTRIIKP